ncbi:MAG: DUF5989 family protein [Planctomycetales bacterium]
MLQESRSNTASATTGAPGEFEQLGKEKQLSLFTEFWLFISENKKWWLIPILLVMSLLGVLTALSMTGAAPFIYTLF